MNSEHINKLLNDFPNMLTEINRGPRKRKIFISCGDGWFNIIYNLCKEIEPMRPNILQIKEKFGGLRFYCSFNKDYSKKGYDFIKEAERQSYKTCETCGNPGEYKIHNGWHMVLCEKHHERYIKDHPEIDRSIKSNIRPSGLAV